ncbi:MAG: hypothetical protein ACREMA_17555 [Longimicrobiales bacterium]
MSAAHTPKGWDSAYPGSMAQRNDGYFLRRDDHTSLAAALVELIASRDREIDDLREAVAVHKRFLAAAPDLLASAKAAEEFISGFDDDNTQSGVRGMLRDLRAAIAKAGAA